MNGKQRAKAIVALLRRAGQAMGLNLSFHDRLRRVREVPQAWRHHRAATCRRNKSRDLARCNAFDGVEVPRALNGRPEGRIHECPAGVTELAVAIMDRGLMVGVLFAGPCWRGRKPPPDPALVVRPSRTWLEGRLVLLRGVSRLLGELMRIEPENMPGDRALDITRYVRTHVAAPICLADLARHISLSPSRARHAIREIFDMPFLELVRSVKLQEGAHLLRTTDLPIGEVAARVGYEDQSYFARVFTRHLRLTPRAYRNEHHQGKGEL
jgi:AraC-like DNA-binding protein